MRRLCCEGYFFYIGQGKTFTARRILGTLYSIRNATLPPIPSSGMLHLRSTEKPPPDIAAREPLKHYFRLIERGSNEQTYNYFYSNKDYILKTYLYLFTDYCTLPIKLCVNIVGFKPGYILQPHKVKVIHRNNLPFAVRFHYEKMLNTHCNE